MSGPPQRPGPPAVPRATYRLQLNRAFTFGDAERLVPYLAALGVSHVYASPFVKARAGSTHGYDITDHNALNPEIGDEAAFEALLAALRRHGMGQIVDLVPNHMGVGRADNAWWLDVLEWGRASPYAAYFDIDWRPAKAELRGKVLLPVLGETYGGALEGGALTLAYDDEGVFSVWYFEHRFPIAPWDTGRILERGAGRLAEQGRGGGAGLDRLDELAGEFKALRGRETSARGRARTRERAGDLKAELARLARAEPAVREAVAAAVQGFGPGPDPGGVERLHRLLEGQAYRLAFWRVASDEINYRRFFDINDLAGIRMEVPAVFEATHRLVFRLIAAGTLRGLRIDHVDGLFDPRHYAARLQARAAELIDGGEGAGSNQGAARQTPRAPLYVLVEKILAQHEHLREDWPVAGTTGYDALNLINGLFVDPRGEKPLLRAYRRFVGRDTPFDEVLHRSKTQVMETALSSELQVLANELDRIAEANWRTRDFTLSGLREALKEVVACFPVYRTYVDARGAQADDRRDIDWAVSRARKAGGAPDGTVFDFIHAVLTTDLVRRRGSGYNRREVIRFAMKFQQYTGPVMAKGLEDTAFYRYVPLLSLNEVGGDPRRFGVSVAAFHRLNEERARRWPHGMVATATHDTKRGEDVRARIDALSELPQEWARRVQRWARLNRARKRVVDDAPAPAPDDEYVLYQTLVGSWPPELMGGAGADAPAWESYRERVAATMVKAVREAKVRSGWASPNAAYEEAVADFARGALSPARPSPFLDDLVPFAERIARAGMVNSLAQTVLKLTVPGVPDLYQGSELWDLSLVDPDNRRPVDYAKRRALFTDLRARLGSESGPDAGALGDLLDGWPDGRVKLYVVWRLLELRRRFPDLFLAGAYRPLEVRGGRADHVCAFAREGPGVRLLVAVPRLVAALTGPDEGPPLGETVWQDTAIEGPREGPEGRYRNCLTGEDLSPATEGERAAIPAARLFATFPAAALVATAAP